jgi:hypothetical protein
MKKPETTTEVRQQQRERGLNIRLTPSEFEQLKSRADAERLSISSWARRQLFLNMRAGVAR